MKPIPTALASPRDYQVAYRLKKNGVKNSLRIVLECRHRHNGAVPVSLGVALQEQESDGLNIFGQDDGAPFRHLPVTKSRVLWLVEHVKRGGVSNGVGPMQLTWLGYIQEANRDGGAWATGVNIATGIKIVANHIARHGQVGGLAAYNAGDPDSFMGRSYARQVMERQKRIHQWITK